MSERGPCVMGGVTVNLGKITTGSCCSIPAGGLPLVRCFLCVPTATILDPRGGFERLPLPLGQMLRGLRQ